MVDDKEDKKEKLDNPIITELELSYTNYWYLRSFPIASKEWQDLRKNILERDNYTCRFCRIRLSKYMIVDHIDGKATNNDLSNLGLNCRACDAIRHSGLACIQGKLLLVISKLTQVEIVKRTHQFYLENNRIPKPEEIDEKAKIVIEKSHPDGEDGDILTAFEIANERFIFPNNKDKWKDYKGFFSKKMKMDDYLKFIIS